MTLVDVLQKTSVIEFEDKHTIRDDLSGKDEPDNETIRCEIPELNLGERIILNAWGSWEVHHFDEYRRRLGIYSVVSKGEGENVGYTFKKEKGFSDLELVHAFLSGNFASIGKDIEGKRYIALDQYGRLLEQEP